MPQFDTFSFFSQLFWVFFGFLTLYLIFTFSILPALAAILKTRKRKLASQGNINSGDSVAFASTSAYESTNSVINTLNTKISSFDNSLSTNNTKLINNFNVISLQTEASNKLNINVLSQAQLTTLFYN
jgi:hypothetical protein